MIFESAFDLDSRDGLQVTYQFDIKVLLKLTPEMQFAVLLRFCHRYSISVDVTVFTLRMRIRVIPRK